jgi:hypothetical protein
MTLRLRKVGLIASVVGLAVAGSIEILGRFLDSISAHTPNWWSTLVIVLWPTSLALIETSHNWQGYLALVIAALINGALYGFVAVILAQWLNLLAGKPDEDWWPKSSGQNRG